MKKLLACLPVMLLSACAMGHYSRLNADGSRTEYRFSTLFSNSTAKGIMVDGNGTNQASPGLHMVGIASDPNAQSITATAGALGSLIGTAAAAAAKASAP